MIQLTGFAGFSVNPKFQDELTFDGDLKLIKRRKSLSEIKRVFFEIISRENDITLTDIKPDVLMLEKQQFLKNARLELTKIINEGNYIYQEERIVYVYTIEYETRTQVGILADLDYRNYDNGTVLAHEETLANKIEIIAQITKDSGVYNGFPIIFARFPPEMNSILQHVIDSTAPLLSINKDQIQHTVYKTTPAQTQILLALSASIPEAFIADGHHRFKGFTKFIKDISPEQQPEYSDDFSSFPVYFVSEESLQIKNFHRVVTDLNGISNESLLEKMKQKFDIKEIDFGEINPDDPENQIIVDRKVNPLEHGQFTFFFHQLKKWFEVSQKKKITGNPVESLDINYLTEFFFKECLGVNNMQTCDTVQYYPSIMGMSQFVFSHPTGLVTVLCCALTIEEVKKVARNGLKMPPKATLFYPKPLLGMLFKSHLRFHKQTKK